MRCFCLPKMAATASSASQNHARRFSWICHGARPQSWPRPAAVSALWAAPTLNPVSYTHLDVYKRQRLERLAPLRGQGVELIAVDGGSTDASMAAALPFVDIVLTSPRGRGKQMNRGAAEAKGDVLLFLHADTILPVSYTHLDVYKRQMPVSTPMAMPSAAPQNRPSV